MPAKLLTTGQVARLCGFSQSAVLQWLHSGKLSSYSSPGGQHRVDPNALLQFLKAHGMRVPGELEEPCAHRILVVDDEELVRNVLVRLFEASNIDCAVEVAENGVIGCMKLATFRPHLVILDVVMPEVDGAEVCRTILASEALADTKVLLLTGYPEHARLTAALRAGADDWVCKPPTADELLGKVARLLGIPASAACTRLAPTIVQQRPRPRSATAPMRR